MRARTRIVSLLVLLIAGLGCQTSRSETVEAGPAQPAAAAATITYVANEGVLVAGERGQVLIDGLHRLYKRDYAYPPPDLLDALERARAPYDRVDLILVTHLHLDHFHPVSVARHLKSNPKALLVCPRQVADEIAKESPDYEAVRSRIVALAPEFNRSIEVEESKLPLRVLALHHSSERFSWIQNFAYVVDVGGARILHVGDADMTVENFAPHHLADEKIDVAFVPYWFVLDETGRKILDEQIRAKHVVAFHISPADAAEVQTRFAKDHPSTTPLTKILETRRFDASGLK